MKESEISRLRKWIDTPSEKQKILLIYGPTASWKSALSVEIGQLFGGWWLETAIISADARQIYRWLDIGTGKITKEEMWWIPHHMIDIIDPLKRFSVVEYKESVKELDFWKKWNTQSLNNTLCIPILCGWTGLYIDSLIYKRSYPDIPAYWDLRSELEKYRIEHWNEALWNKLYDIDPQYAKELHPNNYHYVIRGIEVKIHTGKSKLEIQDGQELIYDTYFLTPYHDSQRNELYERINIRVEKMFDSWLIDEVNYNINKYTSSAPGLKTIGYKEVVHYLEWNITIDVTKELVKQHNRNYAKRQITWNKKYETWMR